MPLVCSEVTAFRLIPGTGTFVDVADQSWDSTAISIESVSLGARWSFSFDPVPSSAFYVGVFDARIRSTPEPALYAFAVQYEIDRFWVWINGSQSGPFTHGGERIRMESRGGGTYSVYRGGDRVFST